MEPVGSIVGAIYKLIKEIAKTARLNRTRCQELAQRMEDVGNKLRASKAGAKGDAAAAAKRSILCRLKEALGNAVKLVESCSKKGSLVSRLHRFLASGTIAARFDDVHRKISNCLLDLSAASGVIIESKVDWLAARDRTTEKSKNKGLFGSAPAPAPSAAPAGALPNRGIENSSARVAPGIPLSGVI